MRRTIALVVLAATGLIASCSNPLEPGPRDEFTQARTRLERSHNWYFGRAGLADGANRLKDLRLNQGQRMGVWRQLSDIHLRLGETDEALKAIERAVELAPARFLPMVRGERGVVWMRQGELRNCVLGHSEQSCIFPLEAGGEHVDKRPAERAREDLLYCLDNLDPKAQHLIYQNRRWLLNIVAMQLGRYPEAVPEKYRLEPGTLKAANPEQRFVDVARGVGIKDRSLVGGTVVDDMDGDGLLDILMSSTDLREPLRLFHNQGDGTFEQRTLAAQLEDQLGAFNVRVCDYDRDLDLDILLVRGAFNRQLGEVRRSLLRNNGDGTFSDVTRKAGLAEPAHPTGTAAWGDFDNDGFPDLVVANESFAGPEGMLDPHPCQLFHNNGDGTFSDISQRAGVDALVYAKGVAVGDYDNDGFQDIYINNFHSQVVAEKLRGNLLYHNKGDGTFEEVSQPMGIVDPHYRGFGCFFYDYDNDGWLDLFAACYATDLLNEVGHYLGLPVPAGNTAIYHNEQGKRFVNVSQKLGITGNYAIMGCSFGDIDNDGWQDLYFGTGSVQFDYLVPNRMFRNVEGKRYQEVTFERGVGHLQKGHGAAFADLDQDGDQDLFVKLGGNFQGDAFTSALFENPGPARHFVHLVLKSPQPLGTRLRVDLPGGRQIHRAVGSVSSFGYTPLRQEIGLGDATRIERIVVRWPSGETREYVDPPIDTLLELTQGQQNWVERPLKPFALKHSQRQAGEWCLQE